jgi:hypothetical protein
MAYSSEVPLLVAYFVEGSAIFSSLKKLAKFPRSFMRRKSKVTGKREHR